MIFTKIPSTAIMSILAENESGPLDSTLCVFMGVEFTIILHGLHYGNFTFPRGSISPKGMADNRIDFFIWLLLIVYEFKYSVPKRRALINEALKKQAGM